MNALPGHLGCDEISQVRVPIILRTLNSLRGIGPSLPRRDKRERSIERSRDSFAKVPHAPTGHAIMSDHFGRCDTDGRSNDHLSDSFQYVRGGCKSYGGRRPISSQRVPAAAGVRDSAPNQFVYDLYHG